MAQQPLQMLPMELWFHVCHYLRAADIARLEAVHTDLWGLVAAHPVLKTKRQALADFYIRKVVDGWRIRNYSTFPWLAASRPGAPFRSLSLPGGSQPTARLGTCGLHSVAYLRLLYSGHGLASIKVKVRGGTITRSVHVCAPRPAACAGVLVTALLPGGTPLPLVNIAFPDILLVLKFDDTLSVHNVTLLGQVLDKPRIARLSQGAHFALTCFDYDRWTVLKWQHGHLEPAHWDGAYVYCWSWQDALQAFRSLARVYQNT